MTARGSTAAVLVVALSLPASASIAHAHPYAVTRTALQPPPPPDASASFEYHQDGAAEAMRTGDWDLFLDHSERALRSLAEDENTHAARAEIMQPVGVWEVDARNEEQLRRSVSILNLYVEQLRHAYGSLAENRPGWAPAHQYLEDMRSRLPTTTAAPRAAPTVEGTLPPPPPIGSAPRDSGASPGTTAMIIGGGVATGVGGVLLVSGLALIGPWVTRATGHDDLKREQQICECVTQEQHDASWARYTSARNRSLGLTVTGVVLAGTGAALLALGLHKRKRQGTERMSVALGGFHLRF